jgi:hypothetical protein
MGLSMAYVIVTAEHAPAETGDWVLSSGTRAGWVAYQIRDDPNPYRPDAPWSHQRGTMLTAVVVDSDFAVLVGWIDGAMLFRLMINEESAAEYGWSSSAEEASEEVQAAERGHIITGVRNWTTAAGLPEPSVDRLDAVLVRGYVLAEEGLFSLLDEIGVTDPDTNLRAADPASLPMPEPFFHEAGPVNLVDGSAAELPTRPRVVYLAAPIEHASPRWRRFVRRYELEEWGQPPCVLATSKQPVPAGELTTWPDWNFYLASDPALELFGWSGPLGYDFESSLPDLGSWRWVPDDAATDVLNAVAWARITSGPVCRRRRRGASC